MCAYINGKIYSFVMYMYRDEGFHLLHIGQYDNDLT